MEYTVNKLAKISNLSARTLRYYDEINLLSPARINSSGYRIYGEEEVKKLQQILFYRELGFSLKEIDSIMSSNTFDYKAALGEHLQALLLERQRLDQLISNVTKTMASMEGRYNMKDEEKFNGFQDEIIDRNERLYGNELRDKYGEKTLLDSNQKIREMSKKQYCEVEELLERQLKTLKEAYQEGNPKGDKAMEACDLHRQWIEHYWPAGMYTKEAHLGLGKMYVEDERFKEFYENVAVGITSFFEQALQEYCK